LYFGEGVNIRKLPIKSWKNGRLTPIANLNELEWVRGLIYANVWLSPLIAVIDPVTGIVVKWIDLSSLVRVEKTVDDMVANGIAFDKVRGKLYVTGKWWKRVYEIEL
jgi:glutaminyl-peptide cyclotransferase